MSVQQTDQYMSRKKLTTYEKCERYLSRVTLKCGGNVNNSFTTNSAYFEINGRKVRLSDHISTVATNQHGMISIVIPSNDSDKFIIQCHGNGRMSVVDYEQVKEFVRTFSQIPMIFGKSTLNGHSDEGLKEPPVDGLNVLGIPANVFTDGQLKLIKGITRKAAYDNGFKFNL